VLIAKSLKKAYQHNQVNGNNHWRITGRDDAHIIAGYGTFKFVEAKEEIPQFYQDSCLRYILWPKAISWKP